MNIDSKCIYFTEEDVARISFPFVFLASLSKHPRIGAKIKSFPRPNGMKRSIDRRVLRPLPVWAKKEREEMLQGKGIKGRECEREQESEKRGKRHAP